MKKLLLASVIAIASVAAMIAPADARSRVIIGIGGGYADDYNDGYYNSYGDYGDRYSYRPYYQYDAYDNGYRPRYYHRHYHRCHIELVKHWRHHHRIVEEIRVCG
ncbi:MULTISPECIES: hypothetical protein [unclassified Mesorhizobium]|uniref:hypothetical protein n=1 Tax=unclassified Mesorhizobium TaxID=325217 RepID=UPI0003CF420B|nr:MULTISPECIES: hypothetical protein [unclassified Mesorhizobium]ESY54116.1 hypothetical protein X745_15415 [Mesorhizobium sp. LNJC374B00]ESY59256.1 hypothetical protein X744_15125 [Mesorhizobium sp. LNJC372A00]WJI79924.1 hypothetical protein NLY34_24150 [Mesorhizobium sp. C374B]WJI86461.1 hypothetical protein NLY42_26545 [Mesorhizobium sp. C372A]